MTKRTRSAIGLLALMFMAMPGAVGCQTDLTELLKELEGFTLNINSSVNQLQTVDPRDPNFQLPGGKNLMITDGVDFITDPGNQIDPNGFNDSMLLGFENTSANDMYIEYAVDDEFQSVYVLPGETVLLNYDCASSVSVSLEEDYDSTDYTLVNSLDWSGTTFTNPDDFDCASALIISMDGVSVNAEPETFGLGGNGGPPPPPPPGMGPGDGMNNLDPGDPFMPS